MEVLSERERRGEAPPALNFNIVAHFRSRSDAEMNKYSVQLIDCYVFFLLEKLTFVVVSPMGTVTDGNWIRVGDP